MHPVSLVSSRFYSANSSDSSSESLTDDNELEPMEIDRSGTSEMFCASSEEDSDSIFPGPAGTPKRVREFIESFCDDDIDPEYSLTRRQEEFIADGIQLLASISSSPKRRDCADRVKKICLRKVFGDQYSGEADGPPSPTRQREAASLFKRSSWCGAFLGDLVRLSSGGDFFNNACVVDYAHIGSPDRQGDKLSGYHLKVHGKHEEVLYSDVVVNQVTGVSCAQYGYEQGAVRKFSSFYPGCIGGEKQLQLLLANAKRVADAGARVLLEVPACELGNKPFYAEAITEFNGAFIKTVYPLMFVGRWSPDGELETGFGYTLDAASLTAAAATVLYHGSQNVDESNPVRYSDRLTVTLDIGPIVDARVLHGVYIRYPRTLLKGMPGYEDCID